MTSLDLFRVGEIRRKANSWAETSSRDRFFGRTTLDSDTVYTQRPMKSKLDFNHRHDLMVAMGNASVAAARESANADPLRPRFHITPASRGCGDPNGLIYFNGTFHLFFQHTPFLTHGEPLEITGLEKKDTAGTGWGHVSSKDLVHWKREPIALMYVPGEYNDHYCASGSIALDRGGTATAIYTSVSPDGRQSQSVAYANDSDLRDWTMYEANPVIREPPIIPGFRGGFRDPFVYRIDGGWRMLVGAGVTEGGALLIYDSEDLRNWEYISLIGPGMGNHCQMWECPNLLQYGDRGILIVSPLVDNDDNLRRSVQYTICRGENPAMPDFYATNCLEHPDGRKMLWGMILGGGSKEHPWWGQLSLPRVISLRTDERTGITPAAELQGLRGSHWAISDIALDPTFVVPIRGGSIELIALIDPGSAIHIDLDLHCSEDFTERTNVRFSIDERRIAINEFAYDFELLIGEALYSLHVFIDRSVIEVFVNDRECGTATARYDLNHDRIRFGAHGGTARIVSIDAWEIEPVFQ